MNVTTKLVHLDQITVTHLLELVIHVQQELHEVQLIQLNVNALLARHMILPREYVFAMTQQETTNHNSALHLPASLVQLIKQLVQLIQLNVHVQLDKHSIQQSKDVYVQVLMKNNLH